MVDTVSASATDRAFVTAYRAMRADGAIQLGLPAPSPPPPTPAWIEALGRWVRAALRPVGRAFGWLLDRFPDAPYARIVLWSVLAAAAAGLALALLARVRRWRRRPGTVAATPAEWRPDVAAARASLEEAEALAAGGAFAEAVRRLLHRSVEDIARRRPRLVVPSLTSRDIAASPALPAVARTTFGDIAAVVERSLFGGRPVDAADWARVRAAYADLMLRRTWAS